MARPDPRQGARAVPRRRALGRPRLPRSSTCRPAPATSRWRSPACCRRPRCSWSRRPRRARRRSRRASPTWPAARTSRCSASSRTCTRSSRPTARATRSSDRVAAAGSPRSPARRSSARSRSTRAVSEGGDIGKPVVLAHPELPAARALTEIARRIVEELLPPVEMAGCTARMFDLVEKLAPAAELARLNRPRREQALVFGEVAEQYDRARPSYPDALFDTVIEYGELRPGDAALEIGAGTGKATRGFAGRGLAVHALEPSPGMARVLRATGVDGRGDDVRGVDRRTRARSACVFAAQAWHWVPDADRYEKVAAALAPGGTLALFWNKSAGGQARSAPTTTRPTASTRPRSRARSATWELDRTLDRDRRERRAARPRPSACSRGTAAYTTARVAERCSGRTPTTGCSPDDATRAAARRGRPRDRRARRPRRHHVRRRRCTSRDAPLTDSVGDPQRDRGLDARRGTRRCGGREQRADERADRRPRRSRTPEPGT